MEKCTTCLNAKATLECGHCHAHVCKYCAHILEEGAFSFDTKVPDILKHQVYCNTCFEAHVQEPLSVYNSTMEKAKEVFIFQKSQSKETRLIKRVVPTITVSDCADEEEAFMRLAFQAAKAGFNAVIDVDAVGKKVRTGSYQTTIWKATGLPAQVNSNRLVKDRSIWSNPN